MLQLKLTGKTEAVIEFLMLMFFVSSPSRVARNTRSLML